MKHLIYLLAISLFVGCNTWNSEDDSASADSNSVIRRTDTVYLIRNTQITPANSYSDLFLDSIAVEQFIQQKNLSGEDAQNLKSFYNYRNGQFAWFTSNGFSEQARGFWNLQDAFKTQTMDTALQKRMDNLLNTDSLTVSRFDASMANTELNLTHVYLQFYKANRDKIQFANISPEKLIPVKKENETALADSLLLGNADSLSGGTKLSQYLLLKQKLQLYNSLHHQGGWQPLSINPIQLKRNSSSPDVLLLKQRLSQTGDYNVSDTTTIYNDSLDNAIKNYQQRNGMKATGLITDALVQSLNIPVAQRIQQLIVNLNRAQWMPVADATDYIVVNIPDFMLSVFENGTKVFDMPVVVGKEGTNTMMFSGILNQIVFSPYWNIPASIIQKEILPAIKADPDYLKKNKMEITSRNDSLPVIRQLPGDHNSLGEVKFLFPNRYDIYLHDTKAKGIFKAKNRAASHGCIRLADAEKMSNYLLRDMSGWTPEKVHTAMNSGKEQYVKLNKPVTVSLTYLTAWVDDNGQLQFRDDIYGHDKNIGQMMFNNNTATAFNGSKDSASQKN